MEKAIEDIRMAIMKSNPGQRDVKEKNVNAKNRNKKKTLLEFKVKFQSSTSNLGENKYTKQMVQTTQRLTQFESIDCTTSNSKCMIDLR